jgi:hypothetical protein
MATVAGAGDSMPASGAPITPTRGARRWLVVGAWLAFVLIPDLAIRAPSLLRGSSGRELVRVGWLTRFGYVPALLVSLGAWLALAALVDRLRARRPWLAALVLAIVAALTAFAVVATLGYFGMFHKDVRPIYWQFALSNPRYSSSLILSGAGALHRAALVLGPCAVFAAIWLGGSSFPRASAWTRRVSFGLAPLLVAGCLASSVRLPADLHGLRTMARGTWTFVRRGGAAPHTLPPPRRPALRETKPRLAPDVVIFLGESLGAWQCAPWSAQGSTPELAAFLARDPVRRIWFARATAAANMTSVSLPSLLTGLAPDAPRDDYARAPLLWHYARAHGYRTALISAQELRFELFEQFFLGEGAPDLVATARTLARGEAPVMDLGVDDARAADAAIEWLARTPLDRPRLLIVQLNDTHWPCWGPGLPEARRPSLAELQARCSAAVAHDDRQVGRILRALEDGGRLPRTLILGTADHGEAWLADRPTRALSYFDEVLVVPMFVHLPDALADRADAARANAGLRVQNLDLLPTLLDVWGDRPPDGAPRLAGSSLLAPIDPGRPAIAVSDTEISEEHPGFAIYRRSWKWVVVEGDPPSLFDLERDPGERVDATARLPAEARAAFDADLAAHPRLRAIAREAGARP